MSNSDLRKLQQEIESLAVDTAKKSLLNEKFPVECPHCGRNVSVPVGKSRCPKCKGAIELKPSFRF